jgi:hypothetical protein
MKKQGTLTVPSKSPIQFRVVRHDANSAVVEMGVDYSKAGVPDRAYYADYCNVVKDRQGFTLIFGKLVPGTTRLRTQIEISFPEDMFVRQLWGSSRDFQKTIEQLATEGLTPIENVQDTDKVQTFRSNNVFMGAWGQEAVMDFYYISPKDMHMFAQGRHGQQSDAMLEPVVRVAMGTGLMLEFLNKCGNLVPREMPETITVESRL